MKWTDVQAGKVHGATQRILHELGEHAGIVVHRVNTDPAFLSFIVQCMKHNRVPPPAPCVEMLGSVDDVIRCAFLEQYLKG